MTLRAIQQFVVHIESFRNIDLWYQGAYLIKIQIYQQIGSQKNKQKQYAHPYAHTEHYHPNLSQFSNYDTQVIKAAAIHPYTSSFLSKTVLLKYFQQQVQFNDICHFRFQTDISPQQTDFFMQVSLLFYDNQIKKLDPDQIILQKGRVVKTKIYKLRNTIKGIHQYVQASFDGQYFSLANISIHSVCLDYRFRTCQLQLSQFCQLSNLQKSQLLQRNRNLQKTNKNTFKDTCETLKLEANIHSIKQIQQILIKQMKQNYHQLLKQYSSLFAKVITQYHLNTFEKLIMHPSNLGLFEQQSKLNYNSWQQKIYNKYKSKQNEIIFTNILNQTNLISSQMMKLWRHFVDLIKISPRFTIAYYQLNFRQKIQSFWKQYHKSQTIRSKDLCITLQQLHQRHKFIQKQLMNQRKSSIYQLNVISLQFLQKKSLFPILIQDNYQHFQHRSQISKSNSLTINEKEGKSNLKINLHLVVVVHGFQGSSIDMKLIKNNISLLYPETSYLCATSNEQLTDTDIIQMGNRLATQIKTHIAQFFSNDILQSISFIGHSLGGVIIRAALPRLMQYKNKFSNFLSFSSPHIGYKVNASSLIEAGIWVLQRVKNSNCLRQLTMKDHQNPRQTCLYKISKFEGMKYFKNIYLFTSHQDSYAPYESARIQIHPDFMNVKDTLKQIHCEMVRNILQGVEPDSLHRMTVNFTIQQTNIDSLIGRTAHILFLQNNQLLQLFLNTHPGIFQ